MATLDNEGLKKARTEIQMVFRTPTPPESRMPIMDIIARAVEGSRLQPKDQNESRNCSSWSDWGGIRPAVLSFSGGQRQRIGIARRLH